jgi:PAS domain S-box-containing protein
MIFWLAVISRIAQKSGAAESRNHAFRGRHLRSPEKGNTGVGEKPTYAELEERLKVSERQAAERGQLKRALRESEDTYRQVVERTSDGIAIIQEGVLKFVNSGLAKMSGHSVEDIIGSPFTQYIDPNELPKVVDHYRRRMAGEEVPSIYETVFLAKDGSRLHAEVNASRIIYQGRPADLVMARNVTERKQAEEALRKAHEKLFKLSQGLEKRIQRRTEELRKKSEQLVRAERMAAIGRIANRVAHELRNPVTVIGGFARRLYERTPDDHPDKRYLEIILKEVTVLEKKISEIVENVADE